MRVGVGPAAIATAGIVAVCAAAGPQPPIDMSGLLKKVAERVGAYYSRAQSILCIETVRLQPLRSDLSPNGFARELVYELRVSWEGTVDAASTPDASQLRQLRKVNGHAPRPNDEPECLDPKPVSVDPLAFLLASHQREYVFSFKGNGRANSRPAAMVDFQPAESQPPEISWKDTCVSFSLPARTTGRVWIDAATGDVLRLDEKIHGPFELTPPREQRRDAAFQPLIFDWYDSTIRYKAVAFRNPDESVMLPESVETLTVFRGSGTSFRKTQTFRGYQRFVTDARLVK
jgi:hypothetical protein